MSVPDGEQRCQSVCNVGRPATDKRLQAWYYDPANPKVSRPQVNTEVRLLEKDGQFIFSYKEDVQSNIAAYRIQADGLVPATLVMDAFERAEYRNLATPWEIQNSPIC